VKSTGELYLCRKAILSHQRGLMPQRSTPVKLRTNLLQLILAVGAIWLGATFLTTIARAEDSADSGKIYVLTNKLAGNTIISLQHNQDGSLTRLEEISTGGLGSGPIPLPPPIGGPNPLDSQDALIATPDGRFLLAVNAGSNEVSVMVITKEGLVLADKVSSNGEFPVSLSLHGNLVYVLNSHGNPNINGFNLDDSGKLNPIPDSIRSAGSPTADPAQIAFSPDGNTLIVTERLANLIDIFQMSKNGTPDAHSQLVSNNHTPFGVSFGRGRIIAITETNERVPRIPVINGASVSTYRIESTGEVVAVSVAVPDHQSAACWIRFVPNGHFAYVSNTGSGTLSS
jgi:6-phosphogluconolactonase